MKESNKSLDSQLWHACAGGMVQIPPVNSKVFYFPQGHAEHSLTTINFGPLPRIPPLILSRISAVKFMADPETDEVYAKIQLIPIQNNEPEIDDDDVAIDAPRSPEKPTSFAKTLTQSDANNGGGFSVPRYCAETIFPRLDYAADPPVQTIIVKDVHGEVWKFRHIYRGTPRRHLLTTGWSNFVNQKKLVSGDSIVFLRADNGDLCVGIRRAKKGNNVFSPYGPLSVFLREESRNNGSFNSASGFRGSPEAVVEAVSLAASGRQFEVVYYPRVSTPEFCIRASSVRAAMRVQWYPGIRFKMPFETEDSSRISWFMGSVASVQVADPLRWPNSPWLLLKVTWDEPDLLQNVKRVSPWLVELVSTMPTINMSSFSPPRKKLLVPQHPDLFDNQFFFPSFSDNLLGTNSPMYCLPDNISVGIQGARHSQFGIPLSDLHISNKLQLGLFPNCFQQIGSGSKIAKDFHASHRETPQEGISCLLTMGKSSSKTEKIENDNTPQFVLFGQPILTEQQIVRSSLKDAVSNALKRKTSPCDESTEKEDGFVTSELGLNTGHCKVFMESENVGRTLDLSVFGSYEDLYKMLANMFGLDRSDMPSHVLYQDASGAVKKTGFEPFSDFIKVARRLTISSSYNTTTRKLMTGLQNTEIGLDSSVKAGGALTIFV